MTTTKIAIIEPIGGHSGNDVFSYNAVQAINMIKDYYATLYTCDETDIKGRDNIIVTYKNIFGKTNKYIRAFNYIAGTIRSLIGAKKNNAKIVHLHFYHFGFLEYFNLVTTKKVFGFKVVGTVHDVESFEKYARGDTSRHNYEKFVHLLDGIAFPTEYARDELLKQISADLLKNKVVKTVYVNDVDYHRLDDNLIKNIDARKSLSLPEDKKIILFFGQIKKVKGLDILLKALSEVIKKDPSVLLVVAGKVWKDDYSEYEKIIDEYGLKQYVEQRIGFIEDEDVPYYFSAADVIVLPYRKIYNSGVLIKSMSLGTPVVASDFGPFSEFVDHGKNGFLFKAGDANGLSEQLILALSDNTDLKAISKAEKQFIKDNFSLEKIGCQYSELYNEVFKG